MIIEGLLTTTANDGTPHVAPMGPLVSEDQVTWTLRPFQSSTTFKLLRDTPHCLFHVVDDVLPIVQNALDLPCQLEFSRHPAGGWIIASACRWFRLEVYDWDVSSSRSEVSAKVQSQGRLRDFWGWNRAKHAILEATILATRLDFTQLAIVEAELAKFEVVVNKTAGQRELEAWELVKDYIAKH